MSAPTYSTEPAAIVQRGTGASAYIVATLTVTDEHGHRGTLYACQRGDGWCIAGTLEGDCDTDGAYWSPWASVVYLCSVGVLAGVCRGPGTYGHTDYYLTERAFSEAHRPELVAP